MFVPGGVVAGIVGAQQEVQVQIAEHVLEGGTGLPPWAEKRDFRVS